MENYEVVVVRHGTRRTRRSEVFSTYDVYGEPDAPFTVDYFLWVLRGESSTVVVDTGFAAGPAERRGRTVLLDPLDALRSLGIDPGSGVPVVVTHAHYDHIGNLGSFTASPVHIAQSEYAFWTGPVADRPLFAMFSEPDEIDVLRQLRAEGRLHTFDKRTEVAPGVEVVRVGGHTPGQAVVRVPTKEGPVVLASDAAHFMEEVENDRLFMSMTDLPQSYRVLEWLRGLDDIVVPGHDAGTLARFRTEGAPVPGHSAVIGART